MRNERDEELILCGYLLHGGTLKLRNGLIVKGDGTNALVHLKECLDYCRLYSHNCDHVIWHQKPKLEGQC